MPPSFHGLSVLILESRRGQEMAALVTTYGGRPVAAAALREVPLESNTQATAFAEALIRGEFGLVILLTGAGTRVLLDVVERAGLRDAFVAALAATKVVARGPKPLAVLRELHIPPWVIVPEPNTWRELLTAVDARIAEAGAERAAGGGSSSGRSLEGLNVAVQEYGVSNPDLLQGLAARGARVTTVPVYRWALPEDLTPLRAAVTSVARGELEVVLFTTGMQVVHFFQVAEMMQQEDAVRAALRRMIVASIGPTTSEELRRRELTIDLEASHPKMGFLVREAAERSADLLRARR